MKKLIFLVAVWAALVTGCAAPPNDSKTHISNIHSDFATGIGVVTDYISDGSRTFVICEISNDKKRQIEAWMGQEHQTDGKLSFSSSRFYTGNESSIRHTFRLPVVGNGIRESVSFEIRSPDGDVLFRTPPIIFTPKGGER